MHGRVQGMAMVKVLRECACAWLAFCAVVALALHDYDAYRELRRSIEGEWR